MKLSRRNLMTAGGIMGGMAALGGPRAAWAQGSSGGDTVERVVRAGQMRVVYVIWPPTIIKDPKAPELSGHFIDAITYICNELKVKPVFVEGAFGTYVATLQSGQADLSVGATYATIGRAQSVDFSDPIVYLGWNGVVGPKFAKAYKSPLELDQKGIRIVGVDGAAGLQWVQRTFKNASVHVLAAQTDQATAVLEVLSGRADVYFTDDYVIRKFVREHAGKLFEMFRDKPFRMNAVSWAVRKGDQSLLNFINVALRQIRDLGLDTEWEAKYGADWLHPVPTFVSTSKLRA